MERTRSVRFFSESPSWRRRGSFLLLFVALALLAGTFGLRYYDGTLSSFLLALVLLALSVAIFLHVRFLILARRAHRDTASALDATEQRFQQMAANIQEIFWMLDAETKRVIYVNQAFETVTGRSLHTLVDDPLSYESLIFPEDRVRVLSRLNETIQSGKFDEEFRITRRDGAVSWMWVRGFAVRDASGVATSLVGTAQDVSERKAAERQIVKNLELAESARSEADALRRITLALTQNLSMDYVLDTLLQSLLDLIPCESARVLLNETETLLFVARERDASNAKRCRSKNTATFDATQNRFLLKVIATKSPVMICDTRNEDEWMRFAGHANFRSWLCVPLVSSRQFLGLLSLGGAEANAFTQEHIRLAKSLAIPAAVAIQNARLFERAEIYGLELEQKIGDLQRTQQALRDAEQGQALSEEKFSKVFRKSPVAFSITAADEGTFVDVNEAFERRYGYAREELIGRTALELGIWDDSSARDAMVEEILSHGRITGRPGRFGSRSGQVLDTIYSAQLIHLDGQPCILAVTEDVLTPNRFEDLLANRAASSETAR
jgi:PAS domain S-box-containing protein